MSFYLDDDNHDTMFAGGTRLGSSKMEEPSSGSFFCDNCGGSESYMDETNGGLVCADCFTQSQTTIAASQEIIDYDDTVALAGRISGHLKSTPSASGRRSRKRVRVEDWDQSAPLPDLEDCIMGLQRVLRESGLIIARLINCQKADKRRAIATSKAIWTAYLRSWSEGADYYGRIYPEIRFSFRDSFLNTPLRTRVLKVLAHRAGKKARLEYKEKLCPESLTADGTYVVPEFVHKNTPNDAAHFPSSTENSGGAGFEMIAEQGSAIGRNATTRMIFRHQKRTRSRTVGRKAVALSVSPSLTTVASILCMAFAPFGVSCADLQRWIEDGRLPLLNAFSLLTPSEQKMLAVIKAFFRMPESPSVSVLGKNVAKLRAASGFELNYFAGRELGSRRNGRSALMLPQGYDPHFLFIRSLPLILGRAIAELGLSQRVLDYSLSLVGLTVFCRKASNISLAHLPAPYYRECRSGRVAGDGRLTLLCIIVSACQLVDLWEKHWFGSFSSLLHTLQIGCGPLSYQSEKNLICVGTGSRSWSLSHLDHFERNLSCVEEAILWEDLIEICIGRDRKEVGGNPVLPCAACLQNICQSTSKRNPAKGQTCCSCLDNGEPDCIQDLMIPSPPLGPLVEYMSSTIGTKLQELHQLIQNLNRRERRQKYADEG